MKMLANAFKKGQKIMAKNMGPKMNKSAKMANVAKAYKKKKKLYTYAGS